ncbi:MAG: restriction endonuclease [Eubacteriales bacterium]|nr:restriction endonuclease [Eubacteriales bacterium]
MAIPSQTEMFQYVLETMAGYPEFSRSQAKDAVCRTLHLTEEEQKQKTSSGAPVYESRTGWAVSWLCAAGFVNRVRRGTYTISEAGKDILARRLELREFIRELHIARDASMHGEEDDGELAEAQMSDRSPIELLDSTLKEIQEQLAHELMDAIMSIEGRTGDTFFEKLVTDLLEKMGYGEGAVTPASNDGGIDGIIKTDPLGFNPIFIQAKRYAVNHSVGRPEIQSFAGALGAVTRGAFITTSYFSTGAKEFAKSYPHSDIVLIDGKKLTELMIQYNLGVSVEREVSVKRIDRDYFEF